MRQLATACVGDFALAITGGATPHKTGLASAYADAAGGIPLLRVMNITENGVNGDGLVYITRETHENYLRRSRVFAGDLLVTITGRIASAAVAPKGFEGNINQHSVVIRVKDESASRYLACWLNSNIGRLLALRRTTGGTRPALDYEALKSVPVVEGLPIVKVMEKALRIKREKEAKARELLAQASDLLLSELGVEMPAADRGAKIFYRRFDELSGNRLDPFYYRDEFLRLEEKAASSPFPKARLGEMLADIRYGASVGNNYADEGIPILRISDLKPNEISVDEIVYLPEIDRKRLGGCFVRAGDFLVSRSGTIGVVARIRDDYDGFAFGSFMIKFSLRDGAPVNPSYLSFFLNSPLGSKFFERNRVGAVQGNITIPIIRDTLLILPPLAAQTKIAARIMKIRAQADKIRAEAAEAFRLAKLEVERIILKNQPRKNNE